MQYIPAGENATMQVLSVVGGKSTETSVHGHSVGRQQLQRQHNTYTGNMAPSHHAEIILWVFFVIKQKNAYAVKYDVTYSISDSWHESVHHKKKKKKKKIYF